MGRRGNRSSTFNKGPRPGIFKPSQAPKPVPRQQPSPPTNSMGSAVMSGVGVGMGAAAGSAAFNTMANAMSSSETQTQQTPQVQQSNDTKKEYCSLIQKQFYECLGRDMGNSCHDLQYLLVKGNCVE